MHTILRRLLPAALLITVTQAAADSAAVAFPTGYRDWYHVKTMLIEPGHPLYASFGGLHNIYANEAALKGYRSGRFPDGAVIVFDLVEAVSADNAVAGGPRKVLGVMQKDATRFAATGGWGFEGFKAGNPEQRVVGADAVTACFNCHTSEKSRDYVFSQPAP